DPVRARGADGRAAAVPAPEGDGLPAHVGVAPVAREARELEERAPQDDRVRGVGGCPVGGRSHHRLHPGAPRMRRARGQCHPGEDPEGGRERTDHLDLGYVWRIQAGRPAGYRSPLRSSSSFWCIAALPSARESETSLARSIMPPRASRARFAGATFAVCLRTNLDARIALPAPAPSPSATQNSRLTSSPACHPCHSCRACRRTGSSPFGPPPPARRGAPTAPRAPAPPRPRTH